jgi:hypothetical protein
MRDGSVPHSASGYPGGLKLAFGAVLGHCAFANLRAAIGPCTHARSLIDSY